MGEEHGFPGVVRTMMKMILGRSKGRIHHGIAGWLGCSEPEGEPFWSVACGVVSTIGIGGNGATFGKPFRKMRNGVGILPVFL